MCSKESQRNEPPMIMLISQCSPWFLLTGVVSVLAMKHHNQKQAGEEKVYLAYMSALLFITEGKQDRNSNRAGTRGRR